MTSLEIKNILNETPIENLLETINLYKDDNRATVQKLISVYNNKYNAYIKEIERLKAINDYEENYYNKGIQYIAGVDEVGRGPLAGPVVTAAVILPRGCHILGINDSKKLSEKKREELFTHIENNAISISVGIVSPKTIDEINIRQATLLAMKKAVDNLEIKPNFILVDAETIPNIDIPQRGIIKGDEKSISIAAASIIAKVTRDRMMKEYAQIYGEYDFENNKGYGSATHINAIEKNGLCPIHRRSFTKAYNKYI